MQNIIEIHANPFDCLVVLIGSNGSVGSVGRTQSTVPQLFQSN